MIVLNKRFLDILVVLLFLCATGTSVAADNYRLGPGDLVKVHVYGEDDLTIESLIGDSGRISYPFLGELQLSGKTVAELEAFITSKLKGAYLVDPEVTVSVLQYRQFFVNGHVEKPGGFAFQPGMTVRKAISLAGGFEERASKDKIYIVRGNDPTSTPKLIELDSLIGPGDIITVERTFF